MRAAWMPCAGRIEVGDAVEPVAGDGQVLVRMHHASICGSDTHVVHDGFHREERLGVPGYPGHEGVGVVEASHAPGFRPGDRVLTVPPGWLGACLAELQAIDARHLVPIPDGVGLTRGLMAQQLGTTVFAMKRFERPERDVAAVIGAGSAGSYFVQHLRRLGYEHVVVSELDAGRLETAGRLGATTLVDARDSSVVEAVHDLTDGAGAGLVIEAAGYDACRADAVEALRYGGTAGFFGYPERYGDAPYPSFLAFRRNATLAWINGAQLEPGLASFRTAMRLIADGEIAVDHCLERHLDLEDAAEAIDLARRGGDGATKVNITLPAGRPG